ncbi:MAG: diaminopimelate epimerase [Candidatus Cloacimonetes bacterium]|nr:diaminopimelate epimerase [Candidatus Cloacimonadota bacterium]MCF7814310.1 diaminopimelate epimerase [Candidatus Cloacimonadota bacterium]MCF7868387.1 diaminopimelate epimerase [Candidatus Cloacimonadota bacterium]MCF7883848.1 diaminopimelate epimerase [Candidatus Cloacimonadota bacterium]
MKLEFFKMQAQGNDYIYFDCLNKAAFDINYSKLSHMISDRHFGIGADGIVLIEESDLYDAEIRIFNADGSEGKMCGSALRCVTSYLSKHINKFEFQIKTKSGVHTGYVLNGEKDYIKVDLGIPEFIENDKIYISKFDGYLINIGNDHFVTFVENFPEDIARKYGPKIQSDPRFPDSLNVDFVLVKDPENIEIRFWERGSEETLACGSGTAAAVFAGIKRFGLANKVKVTVPGGNLEIELLDKNIYLSGQVDFVFSGSIEI